MKGRWWLIGSLALCSAILAVAGYFTWLDLGYPERWSPARQQKWVQEHLTAIERANSVDEYQEALARYTPLELHWASCSGQIEYIFPEIKRIIWWQHTLQPVLESLDIGWEWTALKSGRRISPNPIDRWSEFGARAVVRYHNHLNELRKLPIDGDRRIIARGLAFNQPQADAVVADYLTLLGWQTINLPGQSGGVSLSTMKAHMIAMMPPTLPAHIRRDFPGLEPRFRRSRATITTLVQQHGIHGSFPYDYEAILKLTEAIKLVK